MTNPIDLSVIRGERKERCHYCNEPEHPQPLMCPRIEYVTHYADGSALDVHLWPEFDVEGSDGDPQGAA